MDTTVTPHRPGVSPGGAAVPRRAQGCCKAQTDGGRSLRLERPPLFHSELPAGDQRAGGADMLGDGMAVDEQSQFDLSELGGAVSNGAPPSFRRIDLSDALRALGYVVIG